MAEKNVAWWSFQARRYSSVISVSSLPLCDVWSLCLIRLRPWSAADWAGGLCVHMNQALMHHDARRRCHHHGTGNTTLTNAVIYVESRLYTCDYQWYFRYFSLLFSQCPGRRGARAGCQDRVSSANTESELPTFQTDTQQPTHQPITFLKLQIMVFIETDNFVSEGVRNLILIIQFHSIHSLLLNILPLPQS